MEFQIEHSHDYREVERLYRVVYPGKSARKFEWLYAANPVGPADVFLARDSESNRIIASYVIMPMRVWFRDRTILIGQAIDGMVHPDYRSRRIFSRMQQQLHETLRAKYEFIIGFPNQSALHPLLNAGAKSFGALSTYSCPVTSQFFARRPGDAGAAHAVLGHLLTPVIAIYKYLRLGRVNAEGYHLEAVSRPQAPVHFAFQKIRAVHPVMGVRDEKFISWRFFSVPTDQYVFLQFRHADDILGYIAVRFEYKALAIIDFCIDGSLEDQVRALKLLIQYCERRRVKSIHFQLSEACYCIEALKKAGFVRRKNQFDIILIPYTPESLEIHYSEFFLTFADTDWV
jgi:hypothetical protein